MVVTPHGERFIELALQASTVPDGLYEFAVAHPGAEAMLARQALARPDVPMRYVEPLLTSCLDELDGEWTRSRVACCVLALVRRRAEGWTPASAMNAFIADLRQDGGSLGVQSWAGALVDALGEDSELAEHVVATSDLGLLMEITHWSNGALLALILSRWDALFFREPTMVAQYLDRVAQEAMRALRGPSFEPVVHALSQGQFGQLAQRAVGDVLFTQTVQPAISDLAVQVAVLPFLAGQVRGGSGLALMRRVVRTYSTTWTRSGAARILEAPSLPRTSSRTAREVEAELRASASARCEHFARVDRLGVGLTHGTTTQDALRDPCRQVVADWVVSQVDGDVQAWETAFLTINLLPEKSPLEDLVAVAGGVHM